MDEIGARASLTPARYISERVDDQMGWYGGKSAANKRWHYLLQILTLVLAASIPVLALSSAEMKVRVAVALIGAATSIAAGLASLYRFREQWADYRATAEALKSEKYRFLTGSGPYTGPSAFALFVDRVESIILDENRAWRSKSFGTGVAGDVAVDDARQDDAEDGTEDRPDGAGPDGATRPRPARTEPDPAAGATDGEDPTSGPDDEIDRTTPER